MSPERCLADISMKRMNSLVTSHDRALMFSRFDYTGYCADFKANIGNFQTSFKADVSTEEWLLIKALKPVSPLKLYSLVIAQTLYFSILTFNEHMRCRK